MSKKVTSSDVAKAAGVSQATVSMILNKKYNVSFSKETTRHVEEIAQKMGYSVPKRRIKKDTKSRKLIVVFCPTLTNPYYVMLLQGIEEVAKDHNYGVFVCNTQRELRMEEHYLKMMTSVRPLGIIFASNPSFGDQVEKLAKEIPVVVISNRDEDFEIDAVALNNTKPGILMAKHLLDLGHKNVAFITPPLTKRQHQRQMRLEGFLEEFDKVGLKEHVIVKAAKDSLDTVIPSIDSEYKMGYILTKELLSEGKKVTAIAGLNDMIAFGSIDALLEAKMKVPGDISVLGCDNTIFSRFHGMSLTTIEHFVPLKGRDACDIIIKKITSNNNSYHGPRPTSIYHIEYEPKLIIRGTTSYARIKKNK